MKRVLKGLGVFVLAAFVIAQFIRPERQGFVEEIPEEDLRRVYSIPHDVQVKLEVACYDCHSEQTRYPWYANVQPLGWWLADHIKEGKSELNLSHFGTLSKREKVQQIEAIIDEVWGKEMPLPSYTWTHRDAVFSEEEIDALIDWGEELIELIEED